jgi:flavin-dependent thymidylate synthase
VIPAPGFLRLVDHMGSDASICRAARLSYGRADAERTSAEDERLIRYLLRHRHCYHPSMEVLTADGWKRWDTCGERETFLVPNPKTRTLTKEHLRVEVFDADENMVTFRNSRMSFSVTPDHRMWFRPKSRMGDVDGYQIYPADSTPRCGHFDPVQGYKVFGAGAPDPSAQLAGFILGDGSWVQTSVNQVCFHLKKPRKKSYLLDLLAELGIDHKQRKSATYEDATVYTISPPESVLRFLVKGERAAEKRLAVSPSSLEYAEILGLWDGLVNSDGAVKKDRPQIQFSSASPHLRSLFSVLSAYIGYDAHAASTEINVTAHTGYRTTLEARSQYWGRTHHSGRVYCATTSTGLLVVRGNPDEFGFVCGNTSPFEQAVIQIHVKLPIFVARQWMRHRTWSFNEISARYSVLPDEVFVPTALHEQSLDNQQGRGAALTGDAAAAALGGMRYALDVVRAVYSNLILNRGVSREEARAVLPVAQYTEFVARVDLHNVLHFLKLRTDAHAQAEIRAYADALAGIVAELFPATYRAWVDYSRDAVTLTRAEVEAVRAMMKGCPPDLTNLSDRERKAFLALFQMEQP